MKFQENYSLKKLNTFRVDASAKHFVEVTSVSELIESFKKYKDEKFLVLGAGANILLTKNFDGLVIKNSIKGINEIENTDEYTIFEVGAGENWHEFVMLTIEKGLGGIENMIYIPGTVGAAPVQNIAAYGQNFEDVFVSLEAFDVSEGKIVKFNKDECEFEYRNSRFKYKDKGKYIVTNVRIKLSKNPKVNTSYFETGKTYAKNVSLSGELSGIKNPTVKDVAYAVMNIRKSKLPEISEVGTAGSVFKNPVVSIKKYWDLKKNDPDLQCYPVESLDYSKKDLSKEKFVKVPAGRLLDNLGWKGKRIGNVGTHPTQALAVVNYGGATGEEILQFMNQMKMDIKKNYDIELEEEILII